MERDLTALAESQNRMAMAMMTGNQNQQRRNDADEAEKEDKGKLGVDTMVNVLAWSGVIDPSQVSFVCQDKGFPAKKTDEEKRQLVTGGMMTWAQANGKEIDVSIRFDKNQIGDMAKGEPLPFGHNAHPTHWCRGTNIEACRPVPDGEKALDVEYDQME